MLRSCVPWLAQLRSTVSSRRCCHASVGAAGVEWLPVTSDALAVPVRILGVSRPRMGAERGQSLRGAPCGPRC